MTVYLVQSWSGIDDAHIVGIYDSYDKAVKAKDVQDQYNLLAGKKSMEEILSERDYKNYNNYAAISIDEFELNESDFETYKTNE